MADPRPHFLVSQLGPQAGLLLSALVKGPPENSRRYGTYINLFCILFPLPALNLNWKVHGKINRPWDCQKKHKSRLSSESGKLYNHNTEAILWLFLLSQDLVEIWKHIVFILEGRKICKPEQFVQPICCGSSEELTWPRESGNRARVWVSGHTEAGALPGPDPIKI